MKIDALTVVPFGKYRGQLAGDIADDDPDYICWLHDETGHEIDPFLLKIAVDLAARISAETENYYHQEDER